ncbi:hypothetical protein PIB30_021747 [Stylosanthes scabra]|uniref:Uncharacterized protein n=1 Tax=Stylosanthes scabra TaxID=79078 RepID=A0ABU6TAM5_9FABA|nr:hypothetical protein [Stylosanthes scabra]
MTYMQLGMAMFEGRREPIYQPPTDVETASASMSRLTVAGSDVGHGMYGSTGSSSRSAADTENYGFLYNGSMEGLLMRVCERQGMQSPVYKPVVGRTEDGKRLFGFEVCLACVEKGLNITVEADLRANEAKARKDASFNMLRSLSEATSMKINDYTYRLMVHEGPGAEAEHGNGRLVARVEQLEAEKATLIEQLAALYGISSP